MNKFSIIISIVIVFFYSNSVFAITQKQKTTILQLHNAIRSEYWIVWLTWDTKLEKSAQDWANILAKNNIFSHSSAQVRNNAWENLYMSSSNGKNINITWSDALYSWIDEWWNYDYSSNSCSPGSICWHFTQVIWKTTKRVWCGQSTRKVGKTTNIYWVCHYDPAGNIIWKKPY